ncbi:MBL fold metallo-hydrolase [Adlercreutzia sp. ZJ141]|uniref:MBL fold metallo-hydrolase n=1 Tax=Adlercreutzia sp. ZJ141 TaxID=2709406 RepID=UPI0013E9C366|nr:MBL fold metallo-hydrolase [Adlercreutzia sp. ZJ141]
MYEEIDVISHSCIRIQGDVTVYFDPFEMPDAPHDADIVCVTHDHYDHFSPDDLRRVLHDDTVLVVPKSMEENRELTDMHRRHLVHNVHFMAPGETLQIGDTTIETVRAYNVGKNYHLREYDWVGYVLTTNATRYYIAGDTDAHPENLFVSCDVALVPVGGTYTFDTKEAADFVGKIRTQAAIPTHYGTAVGHREDGARFVYEVKRAHPHIQALERMRFALSRESLRRD